MFKVTPFFDTEYLTNGYRYGHSYYRRRIGNRTQAFEWHQFQGHAIFNDLELPVIQISKSRKYFYREYAQQVCLRGWSHGSPNKSKTSAAAIFNFGKMSITQHWIKISYQILQEDASRPCADDHVTKSRNQKLIRVTSSNERLKHKCVDLSNHCIYFNPIWYRTQMPHY